MKVKSQLANGSYMVVGEASELRNNQINSIKGGNQMNPELSICKNGTNGYKFFIMDNQEKQIGRIEYRAIQPNEDINTIPTFELGQGDLIKHFHDMKPYFEELGLIDVSAFENKIAELEEEVERLETNYELDLVKARSEVYENLVIENMRISREK